MGKKVRERLPEKQSTLVRNFQPRNQKQAEFVKLIKRNEVVIAKGTPGSGKTYISLATALSMLGEVYKKVIIVKSVTTLPDQEIGFLRGPQPLFSKISTPLGWKDMGDLKVGDLIHAYDGSICSVTEISERNLEDYYKITTRDGRYTFASTYHKWFVEKRGLTGGKCKNEVVTTLDMIKDKNHIYYLPLHKSVEYANVTLPIHPYLLGVLIGDGIISGNHIRFASNDQEIIDRVSELVQEYNLVINKSSDKNINYTISAGRSNSQQGAAILARKNIITEEIEVLGTLKEANFKFGLATTNTKILNRCIDRRTIDGWVYYKTGEISRSANHVKNILEDLELLGKRAYEKSIPDLFLFSDKEDRIELLRGLLDTDGSIKPDGKDITYVTTSEQLAKNVVQLVQSLGGLAYITTHDYTGRVQEREFGNDIVTRRKNYCVYIKFYTDEINPFYLSRKKERFVPSKVYRQATSIKNIELVGKTEVQCIKIDHPSMLYLTDNFIPTHNSMHEKMEPFMMSFTWNIDKICGEGAAKALLDKGLVQVLPLAFVRGISIDNAIVIFDELQNVDMHTFKTMMTRIGEDSKYILLGDSEQIDLKKKQNSCLDPIIEMFKDSPFVGTIEFTDEDCVRNPIIPKILEVLRNNGI